MDWQTEYSDPLKKGVDTFRAFVESWYAGGFQRTLTMDGRVIYVISYIQLPRWSGTVKLDNLRYRYSLIIQS